MTSLVRIGGGLLLVLGLLLILLHPGFNPVPTLVGKQFPMPILLQAAVLGLLGLYHFTLFLTRWLSRFYSDRQELSCSGPKVNDLICTRLC